MTQEEEVLKQISDVICSLDEADRLLVGNCINEMRLLIDRYRTWGVLAMSFIGAELAAKIE